MPALRNPPLQLGRVYRTRDLARWMKNPSRGARRLARRGLLDPLGRGLFLRPRRGKFGPVPPADDEILAAFLGGTRFVRTGPEAWNPLGLGSTSVFAGPLVYNGKRSGEFTLGGRRFRLRRVRFPARPSPEWFVVDLAEHRGMAGLSEERLSASLAQSVREGRFDPAALRRAADEYGTRATRALIERTIRAGGAAP